MIAQAKDSMSYDTVVISKAADAMLAMSGIEASFVLAKNTQGFISISARSRKNQCNALWKSWVVEVTLI